MKSIGPMKSIVLLNPDRVGRHMQKGLFARRGILAFPCEDLRGAMRRPEDEIVVDATLLGEAELAEILRHFRHGKPRARVHVLRREGASRFSLARDVGGRLEELTSAPSQRALLLQICDELESPSPRASAPLPTWFDTLHRGLSRLFRPLVELVLPDPEVLEGESGRPTTH